MNVKRIRKGLLLVSALSLFVVGCELIVDFDRTKIPADGTDGAVVDSGTDGTLPPDTGVDAPVDSAKDAPGSDASDGGDASDATDGDADDQ